MQTSVQERSGVDRAILDREVEGFVKVHLKKGTDTILGATIVAAHAGDMISEITLAMVANAAVPGWKKKLRLARGVGLATIGNTIHPYPTYGLAVRRAADQWYVQKQSPGLTRFIKAIFRYRGPVNEFGPETII